MIFIHKVPEQCANAQGPQNSEVSKILINWFRFWWINGEFGELSISLLRNLQIGQILLLRVMSKSSFKTFVIFIKIISPQD